MKSQQQLYSTCRHCDKPVVFGTLPQLPDDYPDEGVKRRRAFQGWTWWHKTNDPGQEKYCDGNQGQYAAPKDYCVEFTQGGTYNYGGICNRKAKENFKCGIHFRAEREEREKREQYRQERELTSYVLHEVGALQKTLHDRFGIDSKLEYSFGQRKYTGMITVNPRELLSFLEEIFDA